MNSSSWRLTLSKESAIVHAIATSFERQNNIKQITILIIVNNNNNNDNDRNNNGFHR